MEASVKGVAHVAGLLQLTLTSEHMTTTRYEYGARHRHLQQQWSAYRGAEAAASDFGAADVEEAAAAMDGPHVGVCRCIGLLKRDNVFDFEVGGSD